MFSRYVVMQLMWLYFFSSNDVMQSLGFVPKVTTSRTSWIDSNGIYRKNRCKSAQILVHSHNENESNVAEMMNLEERNDEQEFLQEKGTEVGEKKRKKKKTETLKFGGQYNYRSPVFSISSSETSFSSTEEFLYNFFNKESIQHMLLSGGKDGSTIEKIPNETIIEFDLISKWNEQIDKKQLISSSVATIARPDPSNDSIVLVTPPGIELVTVSIIPTTTIGTKLIQVEQSVGVGRSLKLPEFQATLIADEPRATGPKFFVWLFNKITYGGNPDEINKTDDDGNKQNKRSENALLRLRLEPVIIENEGIDVPSDNTTMNFVFVGESTMLLEFEFPKLLLRFFPMKKDTAEKMCSESIVKALEKNMLPAMEAFCEEYESIVK